MDRSLIIVTGCMFLVLLLGCVQVEVRGHDCDKNNPCGRRAGFFEYIDPYHYVECDADNKCFRNTVRTGTPLDSNSPQMHLTVLAINSYANVSMFSVKTSGTLTYILSSINCCVFENMWWIIITIYQGASFQLFLEGDNVFFKIFQCHRTIEKLKKTALYM